MTLDNVLDLDVNDKRELLEKYWGETVLESFVLEMLGHVDLELYEKFDDEFKGFNNEEFLEPWTREQYFTEHLRYDEVDTYGKVLDDLLKEYYYEIKE